MKKFSFSKSFILNIILLNISVLVSWMLIEYCLRLFKINQVHTEQIGKNIYISPYKSPEKFNNILHITSKHKAIERKSNEFSYQYTFNILGLISDKRDGKLNNNNKNKIRILTLGDSFTEGVGAPSDSSWSHLLENILNTNYNNNFEVFSAGVSSFDPYYSYYLFTDGLIPYKPDIVLLAVNGSDLNEVSIRGGMERFNKDGSITFKKGSIFEWLFATSFLTRLILINGLKYDFNLRPPQPPETQFNEEINILKNSFTLFANAEKKYKFKLITIFHPLKEEFTQDFKTSNKLYNWYFSNFSKNCINLYDYYKNTKLINKNNILEYYWKYDCHHNCRGYNAFAQGVYLKLKEMGVLNKENNK